MHRIVGVILTHVYLATRGRAYHLCNFWRGIETMRCSKILGAAEERAHVAENVPRTAYGSLKRAIRTT